MNTPRNAAHQHRIRDPFAPAKPKKIQVQIIWSSTGSPYQAPVWSKLHINEDGDLVLGSGFVVTLLPDFGDTIGLYCDGTEHIGPFTVGISREHFNKVGVA